MLYSEKTPETLMNCAVLIRPLTNALRRKKATEFKGWMMQKYKIVLPQLNGIIKKSGLMIDTLSNTSRLMCSTG